MEVVQAHTTYTGPSGMSITVIPKSTHLAMVGRFSMPFWGGTIQARTQQHSLISSTGSLFRLLLFTCVSKKNTRTANGRTFYQGRPGKDHMLAAVPRKVLSQTSPHQDTARSRLLPSYMRSVHLTFQKSSEEYIEIAR